jgi:catechol 2,3-dioxygenase-like lactoylglutathione lyase family enzyme
MRGLLLLACLGCATERLPRPDHPDCIVETRRPPQVFGIAAVKLRVSDLAKARAFYNHFLGFAWRHETSTSATVGINDLQLVELEVGPPGPDGRLLRVVLAASTSENLRDPDEHILLLRAEEPAGVFMHPGGERIATHIAHVGLLVDRLAPSLAFYGEHGFQETWRGSADGQRLSWVNLRVPDGDDYLELMLYDQRPSPEQTGVKHHICLATQNVAYAVAVLESRRGEYTRPIEIKVGRNGKRQANLFDPDGTRVELMEPAPFDGRPVAPSSAPPPRP